MNTNASRYRDALIRMANLSRESYADADEALQHTAVNYALVTGDRELGDALLADPNLEASLREQLDTAYGIGPVERCRTLPTVLLPDEAARRDLPAAAYQTIYNRRQARADQELFLNPAAPMEIRRKAAKRAAGKPVRHDAGLWAIIDQAARMPGPEGAELRGIIADRTNDPTWIVLSLRTGAAETARIRHWVTNLASIVEKEHVDPVTHLITEIGRHVPSDTTGRFLQTLQEFVENPRTPPRIVDAARQTRDALCRRHGTADETLELLRGHRGYTARELVRILHTTLPAYKGIARRQAIAAASTNRLIEPRTLVDMLTPHDLLDAPPELISRLESENQLELLDRFFVTIAQQTFWRGLPAFLDHVLDHDSYLTGVLKRCHAAGQNLPEWLWRHPLLRRRIDPYLEHAPYPQLMKVARDDQFLLVRIGEILVTELGGDQNAIEALLGIETDFTGTFRELIEAAKQL